MLGAGCWAHLRRKFYDLHISGVSKAATDTIIATLDGLSQMLTRIARGWPVSELEALMPWNFRPDVVS